MAALVGRGGSMAISAAKLGTSLHDDTDGSSYSYPSATYSNDKLYICFVTSAIATGTAPTCTGISGGGLTWVEIGTAGGITYSGTGNAVRRIQAFRALVSSGASTGALTISMDGTSTGCHACVVEMDGIDTSGSNGAGAIVQSGTDSAFSETSGAVTLSSFADSLNRPLAFFSHRTAESTTEGIGYTNLDDGTGSSPAQGSMTEWLSDGTDTSPTASWSTSSDWGGFAVEVKATSVSLQEACPDADIVTTGWSTAPLYSKINDASDATVITATAS